MSIAVDMGASYFFIARKLCVAISCGKRGLPAKYLNNFEAKASLCGDRRLPQKYQK